MSDRTGNRRAATRGKRLRSHTNLGSGTPAPPVAPSGLVYVNDRSPGISRRRKGKSFIYRAADGSVLRDADEIARIRRLAIPPAYTQVWICPVPEGHLQATGRDARGRKQYRYHARWRMARDRDKFTRMLEFGLALPRIRARVEDDLGKSGGRHVRREPLLAALVRLLDTTLIRIGHDEYTRANGSYGLTTLRNRHARLVGNRLQLSFRGKSGVARQLALEDPRVARVVRRCQAIPGQELFHFEDAAGGVHRITSADVNGYLQSAAGAEFSAKDFRTWHASSHALALLSAIAVPMDHQIPCTPGQVNEVLRDVSALLGNTVAVCRKSYVHPSLLEFATAGSLHTRMAAANARGARVATHHGLSAEERRLLHFLRAVHGPERTRQPARSPRHR